MTAFATFRTTIAASSVDDVASWTRGENAFKVTIKNVAGSTGQLYVGPTSAVDASSGYWLNPGESMQIEVPPAVPGVAAVTEYAYGYATGTTDVASLVQPS